MIEKGIHLQKHEEPTIHYLSFNMNDTTVGMPAGEKDGRFARRWHCANREDYIDRSTVAAARRASLCRPVCSATRRTILFRASALTPQPGAKS